MRGILGYGRYDDDPEHVGCPRAASDMTPCIARDGRTALADDQWCVGCGMAPWPALQGLRVEVGQSIFPGALSTDPERDADELAALVRTATAR